MRNPVVTSIFLAILVLGPNLTAFGQERRQWAREVGIKVGILDTVPLNAITDVAGVTVGQTTLIKGDNLRSGVTAIVPLGGNLVKEKVPGAVFAGNGFGKLAGSTQVNELGEFERRFEIAENEKAGKSTGKEVSVRVVSSYT